MNSQNRIVLALEQGDSRPLRLNQGTSGLSEAYFWRVVQHLGEDPLAAVALGRKWRSVLKYGDRRDYVYRARGAALRAGGRWRESAAAFKLAGEFAVEAVETHVFALGAIDSLARAGMPREAVRFGLSKARSLDRLGEPEAAARARLNVANALIWQDKYKAAETSYRAALGQLSSDFDVASATLGLSTCLLFSGDLDSAQDYARKAGASYESLGMRELALLAQINVAHCHALAGRSDDAWDLLRTLQRQISSPSDLARIEEFLGDVYFGINMFEDAREAYERASTLCVGMPQNLANCEFGMGRCSIEMGDAAGATTALRRARDRYGRLGNRVWQAAATSEIGRATGNKRLAMQAAAALEQLGASYWECVARVTTASQGDGPSLRKAAAIVSRHGYLDMKWRVEYLGAQRSGSLVNLRRCAESVLIERLTCRSIASRMGFLRSRRLVMVELLTRLIGIGTQESQDEALDWVARTRSVALIDEILAEPKYSTLHEAVGELRKSFVGEEGSHGARRGHVSRGRSVLRNELLGMPQADSSASARRSEANSSVWIDLGESLIQLNKRQITRIPAESVERCLKWLNFEIAGAMVQPNADASRCHRSIQELKNVLGDHDQRVCPDGMLWRVPWQLLSETEPILALGPQFRGGGKTKLKRRARIAVWAHLAPDLPQVSQEIKQITSQFPDAVVCLTLSEVRKTFGQTFDYVHVATHAHGHSHNPMFSYFDFPDGRLYALDVARSDMKIGCAVLAACESGKLSLEVPDEPSGFVRAFLSRGASDVFACSWPLDDAASALTIGSLAEALAAGETTVRALAYAREACRRLHPHPYFWGPLTLYGGYDPQ